MSGDDAREIGVVERTIPLVLGGVTVVGVVVAAVLVVVVTGPSRQ